jgi:cell pole-organizing protein PopZ
MDDFIKKVDDRFDIHEQNEQLKVRLHDAVINGRLDSQDKKLEEILKEVKAARTQGDKWHEEDLTYRDSIQDWRETQEPKIASLVESVADLQEQSDDTNTKLNLLDWFVTLCKGVAYGSDATVSIAEKTKKVSTALAAVFSGLVFVWSFFKPGGILEVITTYLKQHKH